MYTPLTLKRLISEDKRMLKHSSAIEPISGSFKAIRTDGEELFKGGTRQQDQCGNVSHRPKLKATCQSSKNVMFPLS